MVKFHKGSSFHPVRKDNGASSYCLKEDTRVGDRSYEFGIKPARRNVKGETAERNAAIIAMGAKAAADQGVIRFE